jgi:hypothetical protein
LEENYHFDPETTVLRRADPDDCDAIINLVEIGEDDIYNRVYSYPKILKLIETAYLAITVIDRNTGSVIGFAAFEDFPQVSSLWLTQRFSCTSLTLRRSPVQTFVRRPVYKV